MAPVLKPIRKTFSVAVGRRAVRSSPLREGRRGSVFGRGEVAGDHSRRGPMAGVSVGTVSKALNDYGRCAPRRASRAQRRRTSGLPAQRSDPEPAAQAQLHRRPDLDRQLRPLQHSGDRRHRERPRARASLGLPLHAPTTRSASASTSIPCWPSASTASSSPAAAPTGGRRSMLGARRCRSSMPSPRSPIRGRSACCPTTAAAPGLPSSI